MSTGEPTNHTNHTGPIHPTNAWSHDDAVMLEELRRTFEENQRRLRRDGRKTMALGVVLGAAMGLAVYFSPTWLAALIGVALFGWSARSAWRMRPGRCTVCGQVAVGGVFSEPLREQRWWKNFLFGSPRFDEYLCTPHFLDRVNDVLTGTRKHL